VTTPVDLVELLERVRQSGDPDARELATRVAEAAKRPGRSVGAALMPKKRGGVTEWQAEQNAARNDAYRDFVVAEFGTPFLTPKQSRTAIRKMKGLLAEAHRLEGGGTIQQDAIRRIRAAGAEIVGDKQLRRILGKSDKK
jgi:hypothetical protein